MDQMLQITESLDTLEIGTRDALGPSRPAYQAMGALSHSQHTANQTTTFQSPGFSSFPLLLPELRLEVYGAFFPMSVTSGRVTIYYRHNIYSLKTFHCAEAGMNFVSSL
jgi:hypothetical protein